MIREHRRLMKFTPYIKTSNGYAYFKADVIRKCYKGQFADHVERQLNWLSGCQVIKFVEKIPTEIERWTPKEVNIYDMKGYIQ